MSQTKPSQPRSWYSIKDEVSETAAEILLFDEIGGFGITASEFSDQLKAVDPNRNLVVGINSPGGSVFDGLAIYNLLDARRDKVTCRVDGIAASIASVIACAGSKLVMPANAFLFIHAPWTAAMGTSDDLHRSAEELEKIESSIAGIYRKKCGAPEDTVRSWMRETKLFTGEEAKEAKLADEITGAVSFSASWEHASKHLSDFARAVAQRQTNQPKVSMKQLLTLLATLNITSKPDASEEEAMQAVQTYFKQAADKIAALSTDVQTLSEHIKATRRAHAETIVVQLIKDRRVKDDAKDKLIMLAVDNESAFADLVSALPEKQDVPAGSPPIVPIQPPAAKLTGVERAIRQWTKQ